MGTNKRRGEDPIPENYKELLTLDQIDALRKLESFGWALKYIRRPKFAPIEVVLLHGDQNSYALLSEDGELDQQTPVQDRSAKDELDTPPDASEALTTVDRETFTGATDKPAPPPPPAASPMAEPLPSSTNDTLPDSEDKPPPKFLV